MPQWLDRIMGRPSSAALAATRAAESPIDASPHAPPRAAVFGAPTAQSRDRDDAADRKRATAQIVSTFAEAARGKTQRLVDLSLSTRRYDSWLRGVAELRVNTAASRDYVIKPARGLETNPRAKEVARLVRQKLDEVKHFQELRAQLMAAALDPHAVLENRWYGDKHGDWATQPEWRHANRFGWNPQGQIAKVDPGVDSWPGTPLADYPHSFVVHAPAGGTADYPWNRGALRPRIIPSLQARFGVAWWLGLLERYGQPQLYANQKDGDTNGEAIKAALRSMGTDWRAIFPEGVEPKSIPFTVNSDLHERFIGRVETGHSIALLGQNLSTEVKGGSFAAAKAQERVRVDICVSDLGSLDETITDQIIAPICFYNWPGDPVPYFESLLSQREAFDLTDLQAAACTINEYREGKGQDPLTDGTGDRVPVITTGAPGAPELLPAGDVPPNALPADVEAKSPDAALNSAQVKSLLDIVTQAATGAIPRTTAIEIITAAFPLDSAKAEAILGPVGTPDFVPAIPAAAPGGAPQGGAPFSGTPTTPTTSMTRAKERASTPTSTPSTNLVARSLSRR